MDNSFGGAAGGHADSHYAATIGEIPVMPVFEGKATADVCVVGGGFAGLVAAIDLARGGRSVILLEAKRIAWAASGRNAGFVSPGFAQGILAIEEKLGLDHARELFRLSMEGVTRVAAEIREAGEDSAIRQGRGYLKVIRHDDTVSLERRAERMARDYGHPLQFVPRGRLRELLDTPRYFGALHDSSAFHIHPLRYARHLVHKAVAAGVRICEDSRAISVRKGKGVWVVRTRGGEVSAQDVVLATSAMKGPVWRVNRAIVPISTYMASVSANPGMIRSAIGFGGCIGDTRRASDYYRVVEAEDGPRLLWGGRITARISQPAKLGAMLAQDIRSVYPQLGELEIRHAWSGLMGYTRHKMPLIGRLEPRLWMATGFGGHGVNTTAMAGQLVASAIVSGDDRHRLFDPFRPQFAWGLLGRAAAQLEYIRLSAMDRVEEVRAGR